MKLPAISERDSAVLAQEIKNLNEAADKIEAVAREQKIPELNPLANKVRDAVDAIEKELARRGGE